MNKNIHTAKCIWLIPLITFISAFVCGVLPGCNTSGPPAQPISYTSFLDIPGITGDEIAAIKTLQERKNAEGASFVYGMSPSIEAFYGKTGEVEGFAALFCGWLTELFGIRFNPAIYAHDDLMAGLERGTVDFTSNPSQSAETQHDRQLTTSPYITTDPIALRSIKTFRIADSPSLTEIAGERPLRLAFFADTATMEKVAPQLNYEYEAVYAEDYGDAYRMLSAGTIDAFYEDSLAEAVFDAYGDIAAADFFPLRHNPVSLSTRNPELSAIISVVQKALDDGYFRYLSGLYNQGHDEYKRRKLFQRFTGEERAYLETHAIIPFAAEFDKYPKCFYNTNEKEWQGIVFDALRELTALTGLEFKIVNETDTDFSTLLKMLEDGEVSLVSSLIRTPGREGHYLWPDSVYLSDHSALISKADFPYIRANEILSLKVGLQKGSAHSELFMRWFPEHRDFEHYDSTDESLGALMRGEVDVVMEGLNTLLHLTNYQEMVGYKANFVFDNRFDSTFGFNTEEAVLCAIFDKALKEIDLQAISGQWLRKTYDYRAKLSEARMPWFISAFVLLFFIFILVIILIYRMYQANRFAMETKIREQALAAENNMLETLNQAKMEFFQHMNHDFKTPLTVISTSMMNVADMLDFEIDRDEMRESLNNAQREVMRMARMVESAMKYSTLHDNRQDMKPLNLAPLLREGVKTNQDVLERSGNALTCEVPTSLPYVYGNADMLLDVLSNLVSNANRYTRDGTILVHAAEGNGTVTVTVRDSGTGIRPELLPRIFERGVSEGGTGLGLYICKKAIESHDGTISAESEYGKGTAIMFTLPVYQTNPKGKLTT